MKSGTLWMCVCVFLVLLGSLEGSSAVFVSMANESQGSPGTRSTREAQSQWVDCIQASEMCSQDSRCSPSYRVMRQCLVGKGQNAMLDNNQDCKTALEVLHNSSLYDCRCKRAMKNELQCLQNYWAIHMGFNEDDSDSPIEPEDVSSEIQEESSLSNNFESPTSTEVEQETTGSAGFEITPSVKVVDETSQDVTDLTIQTQGGDMEDPSPYEPVAPNRQPDVFGLASISSGMHTLTPKPFQCPEAEKGCNPCLNATKACNLNSLCKRHRSSYITTCSRSDTNKGESCNRKRCHKTLRAFVDRVPPELSQRLIFCPCQSEGCAERRRQTIVPDCSYTEKEKPNCLELRRVCHADALCRSRLADYIANCWMTPSTVGTCPNQDNHQACLNSLARLIGTEMTPNYVDNSYTNWTISPWCNCIGSGNQEEKCVNFLRYFTDNTCLRNAIQAYGMDDTAIKNMTVSEPSVTSKAMNEWMDSIPENPNPNPSSSPAISKERNGGQALGEDRSPCLHANILALLPSPALALILAQLVL